MVSSTPSLSSNTLGNKLDTGKVIQHSSHGLNNMTIINNGTDSYGRSALCSNSVFALFPGNADCVYSGLLETETNMRPAYWRYIPDCDGYDSSYAGGADQMILGYHTGPRGQIADPDKALRNNVSCSSAGCPNAVEACLADKWSDQLQAYGGLYTPSNMASQ